MDVQTGLGLVLLAVVIVANTIITAQHKEHIVKLEERVSKLEPKEKKEQGDGK